MKLKAIQLLLTRNDKKKLILLLIFSIVIALIEAVGLSSIMPFIDMSMDFSKVQSNDYYRQVFTFLNFETAHGFVIAFGWSLFAFYLFRAAIILFYNYASARFNAQLTARLKQLVFDHYLGMRYRDYVTQNYSVMLKIIHGNAGQIGAIIGSLFLIVSEVFIVLFLYILMLITNWKITAVFTVIIIIKLLSLVRPISIKIKQIGVKQEIISTEIHRLSHRSFSNFKYLKLQNIACLNQLKKQFFSITQDEFKVRTHYQTLQAMPRLFLETLGFSMVVLLLVYLLYRQPSNLAYILPTLSLFVVAMYRLLPSINRIINGYNNVLYSQQGAYIFTQAMALDRESIGTQTVTFTDNIQLSNIAFHYRDGIPVLKDINLTIKKGEKIAFVGTSGAGKSTLVDLIIGLYRPENGQLKVDGQLIDEGNIQNWRTKIGYIPQQVYLFDGTVADNVCFNRELDEEKLISVLKQANIFDFLQQKSGISTVVGESGVQLSGGQKQRVAIARALYGNPEVLVLDEATSALDNEIEQKIMDEIYGISLDKTLIIIAHRLSTTKNCDKIYTVSDGSIVP